MVAEPEYLSCKERLRELGQFRWEKRRLLRIFSKRIESGEQILRGAAERGQIV